jgi:hypothetical protein
MFKIDKWFRKKVLNVWGFKVLSISLLKLIILKFKTIIFEDSTL